MSPNDAKEKQGVWTNYLKVKFFLNIPPPKPDIISYFQDNYFLSKVNMTIKFWKMTKMTFSM